MENKQLAGKTIGFALTGSFCTLEAALVQMQKLRELGAVILPIISFNVRDLDTRFGSAAFWRQQVIDICGHDNIIDTIAAAEPIGPKRLCDALLVAPCTGNTAAKITTGIIDTPVVMAVKSHLRNARPVVLSISTNDGLSANAKNIGLLLNRKQLFFVPFGQDDPMSKPNSLIANLALAPQAVISALAHKQIQPLLTCQAPI